MSAPTLRPEYQPRVFSCKNPTCSEEWEGTLAELTGPIELPTLDPGILEEMVYCSLFCKYDFPTDPAPYRKVVHLGGARQKEPPPWKKQTNPPRRPRQKALGES